MLILISIQHWMFSEMKYKFQSFEQFRKKISRIHLHSRVTYPAGDVEDAHLQISGYITLLEHRLEILCEFVYFNRMVKHHYLNG